MTVTAIQEQTKKRSKIIFDSGESIVLYKGELSRYGIGIDREISAAAHEEIMNVLLPKRAKLRAMNLLKARPYTVKGLRDKLEEGGYPGSVIDIAIEYVSSYGYLDDLKYAEDFIYTYREKKSRKRIAAELAGKGISKQIINSAMEENNDGDLESFESEQIKHFLEKKGFFAADLSYEDKAKIKASLYRKGYDPYLIDRYI
ncbi:MAG: recombination regulator RecX [Lachnospiraceae bacterium]|nr:recombination regulator RecX [Lachnospiraceae bacterium]